MATEIGTKIKRARERKRWTQRQLAEALKVDRKTVDNWENGRTSPRSSIGALEEVLGIRLDDAAEPEPAVPKSLVDEIMNTEGLTDEERRAVLAAVERTLATERGEAASSGGAPPALPERERPAS